MEYLAAAILFSIPRAAFACDCIVPNLSESIAKAGVVFRGTIVQFSGPFTSMEGQSYPTAVFRVSRVWKGKVTALFTMPAIKERAACVGFWPKFLTTGTDLIVFANLNPWGKPSFYMTSICQRTNLASGNPDLKDLGAGYAPISD